MSTSLWGVKLDLLRLTHAWLNGMIEEFLCTSCEGFGTENCSELSRQKGSHAKRDLRRMTPTNIGYSKYILIRLLLKQAPCLCKESQYFSIRDYCNQ